MFYVCYYGGYYGDLGASICIVMSIATGNWALMSRESNIIFQREFGCVAQSFKLCLIQLSEQEIVEKI